MNFYDVGGLLVRRTKRLRRGLCAEVWHEDHWQAYPDLNAVMRYGHRLTDGDALALFQRTRAGNPSLKVLSDKDAKAELRVPLRPSERPQR